jgi:hypothetical protein
LVVGCWLLVVGCWLLVVGCWLLVVGCWLLVVGCFIISEKSPFVKWVLPHNLIYTYKYFLSIYFYQQRQAKINKIIEMCHFDTFLGYAAKNLE